MVKCGTDLSPARPGLPQPLTLPGTSLYQLLEAAHKELPKSYKLFLKDSRAALEAKIGNFGGKKIARKTH